MSERNNFIPVQDVQEEIYNNFGNNQPYVECDIVFDGLILKNSIRIPAFLDEVKQNIIVEIIKRLTTYDSTVNDGVITLYVA